MDNRWFAVVVAVVVVVVGVVVDGLFNVDVAQCRWYLDRCWFAVSLLLLLSLLLVSSFSLVCCGFAVGF